MTKKQIVEVLKDSINPECKPWYEGIADRILALQEIDVPMNEEIEAWADSKERRLTSYHKGLQDGAKAMRDGEILKRNNK